MEVLQILYPVGVHFPADEFYVCAAPDSVVQAYRRYPILFGPLLPRSTEENGEIKKILNLKEKFTIRKLLQMKLLVK